MNAAQWSRGCGVRARTPSEEQQQPVGIERA